MVTRSRGVVLVLACLSLAACGTVHPGSAAVVDGRSISMRTLDRTAEAYCTLTLDAARQQGVTTVSNAGVRREAIVAMVSLTVARDLAEREGVTVPPASYRLGRSEREEIATVFPDDDVDELAQALEDNREVSEIAVALAEKQTGRQATAETEAQLAELGQTAILAAFEDHDVSFAPRFGLTPTGRLRAETGSISASPVDLEAPVDEELPRALRCS